MDPSSPFWPRSCFFMFCFVRSHHGVPFSSGMWMVYILSDGSAGTYPKLAGKRIKRQDGELEETLLFLQEHIDDFSKFCSTFSELHYFEKSSTFGGKIQKILALNPVPDDGTSKTHVSSNLSITICMYICTSAFISTASVTSLCCCSSLLW